MFWLIKKFSNISGTAINLFRCCLHIDLIMLHIMNYTPNACFGLKRNIAQGNAVT